MPSSTRLIRLKTPKNQDYRDYAIPRAPFLRHLLCHHHAAIYIDHLPCDVGRGWIGS